MRQHITVLAGMMVVSMVTTYILPKSTSSLLDLSLQTRDIYNLQCKGVYDSSIYAKLDLICDDCYNLFREAELHPLCRSNCFTSDYFKGCIDTLLLNDELPQIQEWIKQLHGAEPGL